MLKFKLRVWLAMLSLAGSLALPGCASLNNPTPTTGITDSHAAAQADVCLVWKTISYSAKADSDLTIQQIIANNAARKQICPAG